MTPRRLKPKQRGHWCSFCEAKSTRAAFRDYGFKKFACKDHASLIPPDPSDYQTEGERQAMQRGNY